MPFAIRDAVGEKLDRLEAKGINHNEWAAPMHCSCAKEDCGDYKGTVNPALQVDQYPLPKPEDLFATLAGGEKFTTLDLSQAYLQLEVDDRGVMIITVYNNQHARTRGYTASSDYPFGIASAPALFQDTILQDIPILHRTIWPCRQKVVPYQLSSAYTLLLLFERFFHCKNLKTIHQQQHAQCSLKD